MAARERSTIRFPYGDLDDAIQVAETVHHNFGRSCELDQLAAALGQSISGSFRAKVATAGVFGVIETARKSITLTDLGMRIADPSTRPAASAEAFMTVPLYDAIFTRFQGTRLPGDTGLEAELVRLGVSPKQAAKARQAMQRSADQAGFFAHGKDRLVRPAVPARAASPVIEIREEDHITVDDAGRQTEPTDKHPLLVGLWEMLPAPGSENFTATQQEAWLDAARVNLRLLYGDKSSATPKDTNADEGGTM